MKSTGVVRQLDPLGRVVLPKELRRTMNINEKDGLEIFVDGEKIILKKYEPGCVFCGEIKEVGQFKGKNICPNCRQELRMGVRGGIMVPIHKEKTFEDMANASVGDIVSMGCIGCEGFEKHEKQANQKWKCLNCGHEGIEFKKEKPL